MKLTARGRRKLAEGMRGVAAVLVVVTVVALLLGIPILFVALIGVVAIVAVIVAARFTWEVFTHKVTTRYKRRRWIRRG